MPSLDPAALSRKDCYRLLINAVVPRPIAWVTTSGPGGVINLAPFSFFNGVTSTPPTVSIAIGHREPIKDTLANLRAGREAVVNLAPPERLREVHQSGGEYAARVSEAEVLELALLPSLRVKPPRLACATVAFECRFVQEIPVGQPATTLCLLEVLHAHIADAIAGPDGLPDPHRHRAPARLGERCYLAGGSWQVIDMPAQMVPEALGIKPRSGS